MRSPRRVLGKVRQAIRTLLNLREQIDELKVAQGILLTSLNEQKMSRKLHDYEFKVFSQWGEDGIIQHLTRVIEIEHKTFIEFGVEDFLESNCRFLLVKDNWRGFVIDGSHKNIERLKQAYFYHKYELSAVNAFVTKENINELLSKSGFHEDLGILSIDLDGNDYYILEAIHVFKPRILICEYNAVFGRSRKISTPYDAGFSRTRKHFSNFYFGCSLAAITHLANKKGYSLVGTNSVSGNAFFVRNDLINECVNVLSVDEAYSPSRFREGRDIRGDFTFVSGVDRLKVIEGLPVFNVESNEVERL